MNKKLTILKKMSLAVKLVYLLAVVVLASCFSKKGGQSTTATAKLFELNSKQAKLIGSDNDEKTAELVIKNVSSNKLDPKQGQSLVITTCIPKGKDGKVLAMDKVPFEANIETPGGDRKMKSKGNIFTALLGDLITATELADKSEELLKFVPKFDDDVASAEITLEIQDKNNIPVSNRITIDWVKEKQSK